LKERIERLGRFPIAGRKQRGPGVRASVDSRYPYLIFYMIVDNEVVILHVRHGARQRP
jgi:toxin ParE1/3/4